MNRSIVFLTLSLVSGGLFACSRDSNSPLSPESELSPSEIASQDDDIEILPQFDIQLNPEGQIRPGEVRLNAVVRAHFDAPSFEFRVTAPDLEVARANNWNIQRQWTPTSIPALIQNFRSMGRGQSITEPIVLQIPAPGYYRILLTAIADPQPSGNSDKIVQNVIEEEYWLWVNDDTGAIGKTFARDQFPSGYLERPGPLTPTPPRQEAQRGLAPAGYSSTVFQVRYVNSDSSNILTPVANTRVTYSIFDQYENRVISQGEFTTDANGNFTADCPYEGGWETNTYTVYAENSDTAVRPGTSIWSTTLYPNDPYCQNTSNLADVSSWARVFHNLQVIIPASRTLLGHSRGKVSVISVGGTAASYSPITDKISYPSTSIWGTVGRFAIGHEYAHAVHEKALGGLNPGYGDTCIPHYVISASSYGCALSEGFADFHPINIWGTRSHYYNEIVALQGVSTGPKVEGAVAAFFFDLIDGSGTSGETSETHDTTQYPGSYLATILKTCKYNTSSRASGLDHIVYCLEKSLSSRTGHHWSDRSAVSNFVEGATEPPSWSAAAIYNNWHWNIYRH